MVHAVQLLGKSIGVRLDIDRKDRTMDKTYKPITNRPRHGSPGYHRGPYPPDDYYPPRGYEGRRSPGPRYRSRSPDPRFSHPPPYLPPPWEDPSYDPRWSPRHSPPPFDPYYDRLHDRGYDRPPIARPPFDDEVEER